MKLFPLLLAISLTACGPIYQTNYRFEPPFGPGARECVSFCQITREVCSSNVQQGFRDCIRTAEFEYSACLSRQKFEKDPNKVNGERCVANCSCYKRSCGNAPNEELCEARYRDCYSGCGGIVSQEQVCIRFCDK